MNQSSILLILLKLLPAPQSFLTWKSYLTVLALLCSCSASASLSTACSAPSSRLASLAPVSGGSDCPRSPIFLRVERWRSRAAVAVLSMSPLRSCTKMTV